MCGRFFLYSYLLHDLDLGRTNTVFIASYVPLCFYFLCLSKPHNKKNLISY